MRTLLCCLLLLIPPTAIAAEPTRLTLQQAFEAAEKSSPDLAAAAERVEQANDDARAALAAVLPQVSAQGSYAVNSNQFALAFGPASFIIQPWDVTNGELSARWPVFNPQAYPALSAAKHGTELTKATQVLARQELLYATAGAWWALVASDNMVKAANEGVSNAAELTRVSSEQVKAQVATRLAAVRAQAEEERARQAWISARAAQVSYEAALSRLTGLPKPLDTVLPSPVDTKSTLLAEDTLWDQAREHRPELIAAREAVAARLALKRGAFTGYLPVVALQGAWLYTDNTIFTGGVYNYGFAGLAASWNLYDGGLREARDAKARSQWREAVDQQESALRKVREEVSDAVGNLNRARATLDAARQGATLAREAQQLAKSQYQAGTATNLEVSEANKLLFEAEAQLAQAESEAALAELALKKATGEPLR